jgi:hypothetical protein
MCKSDFRSDQVSFSNSGSFRWSAGGTGKGAHKIDADTVGTTRDRTVAGLSEVTFASAIRLEFVYSEHVQSRVLVAVPCVHVRR